MSKVTLRVRELPMFFGGAIFTIKAASDDAYRCLLPQFVSFYREQLFNDHWGEQAHIKPDNSLAIRMVFHGLDTEQATKVWKPFLDWVAGSPREYTLEAPPIIVSLPAQSWWDFDHMKEHYPGIFVSDSRPGARPSDVWWAGDGGQ